MRRLYSLCALCALILLSVTASVAEDSPAVAAVRAAETAFARTLADRDLDAFASFLDAEAVFFAGTSAMVGREVILEAWAPFFEGEVAPFSWAPETVVVLDSGRLAHSSGPVYDPAGRRIAEFNSIWREGDDGRWTVVFDKGCHACPPEGER